MYLLLHSDESTCIIQNQQFSFEIGVDSTTWMTNHTHTHTHNILKNHTIIYRKVACNSILFENSWWLFFAMFRSSSVRDISLRDLIRLAQPTPITHVQWCNGLFGRALGFIVTGIPLMCYHLDLDTRFLTIWTSCHADFAMLDHEWKMKNIFNGLSKGLWVE